MMVLLVAVGTMNLIAMFALTILIAAEKLVPRGQLVTQAIAVLAVVAALIFALSPHAFSLLTASS
jgi:predicted metal-binding membrane protein